LNFNDEVNSSEGIEFLNNAAHLNGMSRFSVNTIFVNVTVVDSRHVWNLRVFH
jgi:hypothetical protein